MNLPRRMAAVLLAAVVALGCASRPEAGTDGLAWLDGQPCALSSVAGARATVLVYVATDCPVANRCLPELLALRRAMAPRGVNLALVYAGTRESRAEVERHAAEYAVDAPALRDPSLAFARAHGARVTPEAVALARDGRLIYRGRVNDQYLELGHGRPAPTRHDLAEALEEFLSGAEPSGRTMPAVGCTFR